MGTTFDRDWLYELRRRCQIILCELEAAGEAGPPHVAEVLEGLLSPANRIEQVLLHAVLFETVVGTTPGASAGAQWDLRFVQDVLDAAWLGRRRRMSAAVKAAAIVEKHYADDLRVPELARQLGYHKSTLRSSFRREFSMTLKQYQTRARIGAARLLFASGNTKVSSVARLVGYRSEKNFYQAFRQLTGFTPASQKSLSRPELLDLSLRVTGPLRSLSDRRSFAAGAAVPSRGSLVADRRRPQRHAGA